ncbi:MAG: CotH kinase family protein [Anaerolineae bacterium]|nr:CotH kinase family protein [Anaerolineae bacterium]
MDSRTIDRSILVILFYRAGVAKMTMILSYNSTIHANGQTVRWHLTNPAFHGMIYPRMTRCLKDVTVYPYAAFDKTVTRTWKRVAWLGTILLLALTVLGQAYINALALDKSTPSLTISEFMASNNSILADDDGDYSDWIEIHNREATRVDLDGWYLSDDDNDLTRWKFPPTELAADSHLIVFASGKDRAVSGSELHTNFRLKSQGEYLALVKPDGRTIAWEYAPKYAASGFLPFIDTFYSRVGSLMRRRGIAVEYPPQFSDVSYGLDSASHKRYFLVPTPGMANGSDVADQGPILSDVGHAPLFPASSDAIVVTTTVETFMTPIRDVTLHYRIMYEDAISIVMSDDGMHKDGAKGDGIYGATIPGGAHKPGEMVRYYVTATDQADHTSRWPLFHDSVDSPRYMGTMIADPDVDSRLPTLYWFVQDIANARELQGTRAQLFYDGVLYDNVFARSRGYSSRSGWPKKSFKFEFNTGYPFRFSPDQEPVQEFNLNSTYSDKAYIRQPLAWETYRDAGVPFSICSIVRVQQNGAFHSVALFMEHSDEQYLERQGLDPEGALYKMFNGANSASSQVDKKRPRTQDHSDLEAFLQGVHLSGQARTQYLFDHLDIPAVVNYMAVTTILNDIDCDRRNYFLYHDTTGTGEWTFLPWDKDLTFGRIFDNGVLNDGIWADRYPQSHPFALARNDIHSALYDTTVIRQMYLRRLRTVMDLFLQPPGTPDSEQYYERRIDALVAQIQPDVALDAAKWPTDWGDPQTFEEAIDILKRDYLAARRVYLYQTLSVDRGGIIPNAQPATVSVELGHDIDFAPASGDQDQEYLTLVNRDNIAVDMSGWEISGDIHYIFRPGVVLPAGGTLYVSPDVAAFRNRASSPTGGEARFVQGNYDGRLSNRWGFLRLYNADGVLVDTQTFYNLVAPSSR